MSDRYLIPVLNNFSFQPPVADKDLTTPPGSPSDGDRYIVGAGAAGAWAGHDNKIAYYDGDWEFISPLNGMIVWVEDEGKFYLYSNSAWGVYNVNWKRTGTVLEPVVAGDSVKANDVRYSQIKVPPETVEVDHLVDGSMENWDTIDYPDVWGLFYAGDGLVDITAF